MIELSIYNKVFVVLINLVALWLAFTVYTNNPKGKLNRTFLLMAALMFFWVDFAFLARLVGRDDLALAKTFLHIAWFVTPLFFTALYFLIIYLLKKEKEYRFLTATVVAVGIGLAFTTGFTNLVAAGIQFVNEILRIVYGPAMIPFLTGIFFIVCATLYPLFRNYSKGYPEDRKKLQYFIIGAFIFYLANTIFNIVLPLFYDIARFYFIGDYSTIFLLGLTAYAIVTRELFGIRVILTQALVIVIAILLLWQTIIAFPNWLDFAWKLILFLLFAVFGYFLIQSVIREIQQRAELQRLYEEVDRLSRAKSEFLSIASHQLKTSQTVIKGYLSMTLEGSYGPISEKVRTVLERTYLSNERLIRFIDDLLNVARIESGTLSMDLEETSLEELISSIVDEMRIKANEKKLYLNLEKPEAPLPKITIDPGKIRQVILNLIDNSLKYTEKGGVTVRAKLREVTDKYPQGLILVEIKDTGVGMSKEEIENIFGSFTRGRAGAKYWISGLGLGLYIAKKFTELHQGRIWAESAGEGKGSVFFVELPIV